MSDEPKDLRQYVDRMALSDMVDDYVASDDCPFEAVCHTLEPRWAELRNEGMGASDTPELFGEGFATSSKLALWAQKCGYDAVWFDDDAEHLRIGQLVEPAIIEMFEERALRPAIASGYMYRSKRYPWLQCTLDGWTVVEVAPEVFEPVPLELKNVFGWSAAAWATEAPPRVQIQHQHQQIVMQRDAGYIAAFVGGGKFVWQHIPGEPIVKLKIVNATRRFWHENVLGQKQPMAEANNIDEKVLREIYKDAFPPPVKETSLPDSLLALDKACAEALSAKTAAERTIKGARAKVRQALGDYNKGTLSNGSVWKISRDGKLLRDGFEKKEGSDGRA